MVLLIISIILAISAPILVQRETDNFNALQNIKLQIKAEGDPCPDPTSGNVSDNIAITADHTTLLTCQPEATEGESCSEIGAKAVSISGSVITHLVCQ